MQRISSLLIVGVVAVLLAGCIIPKEFEATMDVKKDGSYDFSYAGSVVHLMMLSDMQKGGMSATKEKSTADQVINSIAKDKNASNVSYLGDAVFSLTYKTSGNVNEKPMVVWSRDLPIITFEKSPDGSNAVFSFMPDGANNKNIKSSKTPPSEMEGLLKGTIVLNTELPVVSSAGNPSEAWLSDSYTWTLDGITNDMPAMTFTLDK